MDWAREWRYTVKPREEKHTLKILRAIGRRKEQGNEGMSSRNKREIEDSQRGRKMTRKQTERGEEDRQHRVRRGVKERARERRGARKNIDGSLLCCRAPLESIQYPCLQPQD